MSGTTRGGGICRATCACILAALLLAGVQARVERSLQVQTASSPARIYYIKAEAIDWQFSPGGEKCTDKALLGASKLSSSANYNNHVWTPADGYTMPFKKARYVEYTDDTFKTPKPVPASQQHLGILGPMMYAEAGTSISIVLMNACSFSVNIEPVQGFTWVNSDTNIAVATGTSHTFTWSIPADAVTLPAGITTPAQAAAAGVQTSRMFMYHSSVDAQAHDNSGLIGPIIVTAQGLAKPDGTSQGVDRDIVTVYQVADETASAFASQNDVTKIPDGKTYSINGRSWCNLGQLDVIIGENVRWHAASLVIEDNIHNIHWHGNVLTHEGHRMDAINMFGWNTATLDMKPDSPGQWFFHCHVNTHLDRGMVAIYNALPNPAIPAPLPAPPGGRVVTYYIQAEEVDWNFAPYGKYMCGTTDDKAGRPFNDFESQYLGTTTYPRIGSIYKKAIYVEYNNANFNSRKQGSSWPTRQGTPNEYMGFLGPVIRANVGDTIQVVFKNALKYAASVHPHGVLYDKANEGAPYMDGARNQVGDDAVQPGQTYTYTWQVPPRAGPGPQDGETAVWLYHSHVDESGDTNAGLFGPIVIGKASPDITEMFYVVSVIDETTSIYAVDNVQQRLQVTNPSDLTALFANEVFLEDSKHHSINGWMYCNNKPMTFTAGSKYRFYVMSYGAQTDMHTPSIGGGTYRMLGLHRSSFATAGGGMNALDVIFTEPNQGMDAYNLVCRVHDHVLAGMAMRYKVTPSVRPLAASGRVTRKHYIAAETVDWDYTSGTNKNSCPAEYDLASAAEDTLKYGAIRKKAIYREYTDATFTTLKPRDAYLGMQGPIIIGEEGDIIEVTLANKISLAGGTGANPFDINFAIDGGLVSARTDALSNRQAVVPGSSFTYRWVVPPQMAAVAGDISTVAVPYFSDIDFPCHISSGLYGVAIFGAKGTFKADGLTPKDVDQMLVMTFAVTNENLGLYNQLTTGATPIPEDYNHMHHINGYMYCNMPKPPTLAPGSKVRIVAASFGSEDGVTAPTFVGQTTIQTWGRVEYENLLPTITTQADLRITSQAGVWPVQDSVSNHREAGEVAQFVVGGNRRSKLL